MVSGKTVTGNDFICARQMELAARPGMSVSTIMGDICYFGNLESFVR